MKLHRDLNITQKSAYFLAQRLREAGSDMGGDMAGPVEVDETFVGGKAKNMHAVDRVRRITGRGGIDKTAVAGAKDRATGNVSARVISGTDTATLHSFVASAAARGATVYTDDHKDYLGIPHPHETVRHSVSEYVSGMAHERHRELLGAPEAQLPRHTFHHISPKHLQRYVAEFATRHNLRPQDTAAMMSETVARMNGKRLTYAALTANTLSMAVPAHDEPW